MITFRAYEDKRLEKDLHLLYAKSSLQLITQLPPTIKKPIPKKY